MSDTVRLNIVADAAQANKSLIKFAATVGATTLAVRKIVGISKELIDVYRVQERAETRLASAIRATGGDVNKQMGRWSSFASELQDVTTVGDETTLMLIAQAKTFGIVEEAMEESVKGAIGLSEALGMDLNTALRAVANAQQGNYSQLERYLPALRNASTEAEKHAILQKSMADGFNMAKDVASTATGQMDQLGNAIGDMQEIAGKAIAEGIKPYVTWLKNVITESNNAHAALQDLQKVLEEGTDAASVEELESSLGILEERLESLNATRQTLSQSTRAGIGFNMADIQSNEELEKQIREVEQALRSARLERNRRLDQMEAEKEFAKLEKQIEKERQEELERSMEVAKRIAEEEEEMRQKELDLDAAYWNSKAEMQEQAQKNEQEMFDVRAKWKEEEEQHLQDLAAAEQALFEQRMEAAATFYRGLSELSQVFAEENKEFFFLSQAAAAAEAGVNSYLAFTKALAQGGLFGVAGATGVLMSGLAAQAQIWSQTPKFAQGGDFVTSGPQMMMVGDNATGRERVSVEPLGNEGKGGAPARIQVYLDSKTIVDAMTRASADGRLIISQRGIR